MNMLCCGYVVDTIKREGESYFLMVELEDKFIPAFYAPIQFCPFCGANLLLTLKNFYKENFS